MPYSLCHQIHERLTPEWSRIVSFVAPRYQALTAHFAQRSTNSSIRSVYLKRQRLRTTGLIQLKSSRSVMPRICLFTDPPVPERRRTPRDGLNSPIDFIQAGPPI